ncbi:sideroflexin-2-like [Ostrinia furnacalis]|uniref:sideroflexin-2-like n=1 Tax=Ostrinia furnacalis TaxID=93504 RepID=UPI00103C17BB|nr:sideroflexin-2-like [Ostrinia furnacalis]
MTMRPSNPSVQPFPGGGPTVYTRRRAREPEPREAHAGIVQLLPVLVLVLLSMMSGFFISEPVFSLTPSSKYPVARETVNLKTYRYLDFVIVYKLPFIIPGLDVTDENGKIIGKSQLAPVKGISQVVTSRIVMCAPGMLLLPVIMERLEPKPWMQRIRWAHIGIQTAIVGMFLTFMVPTACAIFPQRCKISIDTIQRFEKDRYEEIVKNTDGKPPQYVYFNKGL